MNHQQKPKDRSTRLIRQLVHPLLAYDPRALDFIDLIELEYFEAETTKAPVPRNQEVPSRKEKLLQSPESSTSILRYRIFVSDTQWNLLQQWRFYSSVLDFRLLLRSGVL